MIADGLLALPLQPVIGEVQASGNKLEEVGLHGCEILRGWRHNFGADNEAALVIAILMIEDATRSFGRTMAGGDAGHDVHIRLVGHLVIVDDAHGLLASIYRLDSADQNSLEGIAAFVGESRGARCILGQGGELIEIQVVAGQWADEVRAAFVPYGFLRCG